MASQAMGDALRKHPGSDGIARPIPADRLLRRDRCLRFEREGTVYATDGRVGLLKRVVVAEDAGEVAELAIRVEATGQTVLLPTELVEKTGGSAVFLRVTQAEFAERAGTAQAYEKVRFARARLRALRKNGQRAQQRNTAQAVAQIGRDFVETPKVPRLDLVEPGGGTPLIEAPRGEQRRP